MPYAARRSRRASFGSAGRACRNVSTMVKITNRVRATSRTAPQGGKVIAEFPQPPERVLARHGWRCGLPVQLFPQLVRIILRRRWRRQAARPLLDADLLQQLAEAGWVLLRLPDQFHDGPRYGAEVTALQLPIPGVRPRISP